MPAETDVLISIQSDGVNNISTSARRRRQFSLPAPWRAYFVGTLFAALSMSSATTFGCDT